MHCLELGLRLSFPHAEFLLLGLELGLSLSYFVAFHLFIFYHALIFPKNEFFVRVKILYFWFTTTSSFHFVGTAAGVYPILGC